MWTYEFINENYLSRCEKGCNWHYFLLFSRHVKRSWTYSTPYYVYHVDVFDQSLIANSLWWLESSITSLSFSCNNSILFDTMVRCYIFLQKTAESEVVGGFYELSVICVKMCCNIYLKSCGFLGQPIYFRTISWQLRWDFCSLTAQLRCDFCYLY